MAFYIDDILQMLLSTLIREVCFKTLKKKMFSLIDVLELIILLRQILQINSKQIINFISNLRRIQFSSTLLLDKVTMVKLRFSNQQTPKKQVSGNSGCDIP